MRVLLIEDDRASSRSLEIMLKSYGSVYETAEDGEYGEYCATNYEYDAIVVDVKLPKQDGLSILKTIRRAGIKTPVLIVSANSNVEVKLKGLSFGADDYVTKPFNNKEVFARLQAIIRRSKGFSSSVIQVGHVCVNLDDATVTVKGEAVHLTCKEYAILELLIMRKGHVISKEKILEQLYNGKDEPELKIIDVFVCKLRKKINQAYQKAVGTSINCIGTIWGRGYIFHNLDAIQNSEYNNYDENIDSQDKIRENS